MLVATLISTPDDRTWPPGFFLLPAETAPTHLVNLSIANGTARACESAADAVSEVRGNRRSGGAPRGGLEGWASESGEAAGDDKFFLTSAYAHYDFNWRDRSSIGGK